MVSKKSKREKPEKFEPREEAGPRWKESLPARSEPRRSRRPQSGSRLHPDSDEDALDAPSYVPAKPKHPALRVNGPTPPCPRLSEPPHEGRHPELKTEEGLPKNP